MTAEVIKLHEAQRCARCKKCGSMTFHIIIDDNFEIIKAVCSECLNDIPCEDVGEDG